MEAYIIAAYRSAVGKAPRGKFRTMRPDDLGVAILRHLVASVPQLDKELIEDVIVGNATPEAEQGLNMGRMISLMGLDTVKVPGMTVNRYCASGLETIAIAAAKIKAGLADCIVAGGVECMSPIPFGGWKIVPNYKYVQSNPDYYWGMGLTAEAVARDFKVSREDQDLFGFESNRKAVAAIKEGRFKDDIVPVTVEETYLDENEKRKTRSFVVDTDEGPRADADVSKMAQLKPVFPSVLRKSGLKQSDIDLIELNEAFASQSLAVMRTLDLDPAKVNVNGGAIALGHPLGCTGSKLTVQVLNELRRRKQRYGMVTMCVGTGQGAAGIFELLN
jgi:acetyl-CoA acyltransferase